MKKSVKKLTAETQQRIRDVEKLDEFMACIDAICADFKKPKKPQKDVFKHIDK